MAGDATPNLDLIEANYTLIEGIGVNGQTGEGLFDQKQVNEWDSKNVFYFTSSGSGYVKIKVHDSFRIWRSGTTQWSHRFQPVNIKKIVDSGSEIDYTSYHLQTTEITETGWEVFTKTMPSGTYVFGLGYWGNGEYRVDSEWFIEYMGANKLLLSSSNINYSLSDPKYIQDVIPILTSNTEPLGEAIGESNASGSHTYSEEPYAVFNKINTSTNGSDAWGTNQKGWVGYIFPSPKIICQYHVINANIEDSYAPNYWTFEASDDGDSWTILDEQLNQTGWSAKQRRSFEVNNKTAYKMYRIVVDGNNGASNGNVIIGEIEMDEYVPPSLKIIPSQTEQDFINYGIDVSQEINPQENITKVQYINNQSSTLGKGKVFQHSVNKYIKSIKIE